MLSRVADSLFWMSRYLERAEHIARVVNVNVNLALDRSAGDAVNWDRRVASLPEAPIWPGQVSVDSGARTEAVHRESIRSCIAVARENARQVREEISSEMWEEVNRLFLAVSRAPGSEWSGGAHEYFSSTVTGVQLFQGVTDATMTHGEGWHFMALGRYLERAGSTASLVDAQFRGYDWADGGSGVTEYVEWVAMLKSCCAFEAYCRHYTADLRPQRIAEFLVLNNQFPRSIHFAAGNIKASLQTLGALSGRANGRADRLAGRLTASLDYGQIDEIVEDLPAYLEGIIRHTALINAAAYQQYVAYPIDAALSA